MGAALITFNSETPGASVGTGVCDGTRVIVGLGKVVGLSLDGLKRDNSSKTKGITITTNKVNKYIGFILLIKFIYKEIMARLAIFFLRPVKPLRTPHEHGCTRNCLYKF